MATTTTQTFIKNKAMTQANNTVPVGQIPSTASYATTSLHLQHTDRNAADANVQVYMTEAGTAGPVDMVANVVVPAGGSLDISCELAGPGENISVASDSSNVAIRHTGVATTVVTS